jgi:hypothetical protein
MSTKTIAKPKTKKAEGLVIDSLRPAMYEIERIINYLRADMDFHDLHIVPVIQTSGKRKTLGHFFADKWQGKTEKDKIHEVQITAERLNRTAMETTKTLRHELVHAKNYELGIKDTSNSGTYHNRKFKASAEKYGLVCDEPNKKYGHGHTRLSAILEAQILAELQPDDKAFDKARIVLEGKPKAKPSKMLKWSCGCTIVRAAVELLATCEKCSETFIKV